jgi:hypothetical protein
MTLMRVSYNGLCGGHDNPVHSLGWNDDLPAKEPDFLPSIDIRELREKAHPRRKRAA